jgi:hypothetical protein
MAAAAAGAAAGAAAVADAEAELPDAEAALPDGGFDRANLVNLSSQLLQVRHTKLAESLKMSRDVLTGSAASSSRSARILSRFLDAAASRTHTQMQG